MPNDSFSADFWQWLNAGSQREIQVVVEAARSGCCSSRCHALTFEHECDPHQPSREGARARVYSALADADAIVKWRVPDGMTSDVYAFEGRGGHFPDLAHVLRADRSRQDERAHGYIHGHLFKLVPNERVVEVVEFETADPALGGEMTTTITLADPDGATERLTVQDGLPRLLARSRKRLTPP